MMTGGESARQVSTITRFAPSPTGRLHLGHAYSAILAHDFARARGGAFLLRIEDIDVTRSRAEHVAAIEADLRWLGLEWDGPVVFQSRRLDPYRQALDQLRAMGLLYPCFCTRAEIAASLSAPHDATPVYPGICRGIYASARMDEPHCWRLDMEKAIKLLPELARGGGPPPKAVVEGPAQCSPSPSTVRFAAGPSPRDKLGEELWWLDSTAGWVRADPSSHGDVVLARKDAPASYHLAVTVDDAAQGVTNVVRGRDLFDATHVHRLLQALLELPTPAYHHHALLTGLDGERLAKRHGAPTLAAMREAGRNGRAIADELRAGHLPKSVAKD